MTATELRRLVVAKGHGTGNDFVLLPDPDGAVKLTDELVVALCDRRSGVGGDGLIRIIRTEATEAVGDLPTAGAGATPEWFMDYRNGDGSLAEMCGNGIRVFVAYLIREGLIRLEDGDAVTVGTRAGVKTVRRTGDLLVADLGPWRIEDGPVSVALAGEPLPLPGIAVDVGNPHVVVAVQDAGQLSAANLATPPTVQPTPEHGANVEVVVPLPVLPDTGEGQLLMRVHERGVGETRSCGTGAVAAVLAARVWGGELAPDTWLVDVPGGQLRVSVPAGDLLAGPRVDLAGPAVIVADITVDLRAFDG
jgi:diaminopimelate epimerase